jgi:hypothetical protein
MAAATNDQELFLPSLRLFVAVALCGAGAISHQHEYWIGGYLLLLCRYGRTSQSVLVVWCLLLVAVDSREGLNCIVMCSQAHCHGLLFLSVDLLLGKSGRETTVP